jgi:nucleoside-diphosphate-sugar epimerase
VVLTSSTAASAPPPPSPDSVNDETIWTDPKARGVNAYRQSKAIAERAAWDFMEKSGAKDRLTTVLPTGVFGPVQTTENLGSVEIVSRMLNGRVPRVPRLGFCVVDVRDVVDAHMRAMTVPQAAGERFIATSGFMWMAEMAGVLKDQLGQRAAKVSTRTMPDFVVRAAALFNPALAELAPGLGRKHVFKADKAKRVLGLSPRPAATTIADCGRSLIEKGAA